MARHFHRRSIYILLSLWIWCMIAVLGFGRMREICISCEPSQIASIVPFQRPTHCDSVRQQLLRLWHADSAQVFGLAQAMQDCFTANGSIPVSGLPKSQADTLLRLYKIGISTDIARRGLWLRERALLGLQRPLDYAKPLRAWLLEAILDSPEEAPLLVYEKAIQLTLEGYRDMRIPLQVAAHDWALLDRLMLIRELAGGEAAVQFETQHKRWRLEMRRAFPDCNQLLANFGEQIAVQKLPAASAQTFLILYDMQSCDSPRLWELALESALIAGDQAWLQRLAGAEVFNRKNWEQARLHWNRAISLEVDDRLKAVDHLQIAQTWLAQKDFRQARTSIEAAMQLHQAWGEPYIRLMDLYLEGAKVCKTSPFDQRSIYWLLIDLCQQLLRADPNYALQANSRLYDYKKLAPTTEEAGFLGFKPGDSCPLKCWMSTTTHVLID